MNTFKSKSVLLVIVLLIGCRTNLGQQSSPNVNVLKGWKKVNAEGLFTFYLPPNAGDPVFIGLDEFYREWRIGRMRFMFAYEPMSVLTYDKRERVFGRGFQESMIEIGGRKTYFFEYSLIEKERRRHYAELYVGNMPMGQVRLWMQANSARSADLEIAKKIFHTVEFLKP